MCLDFFPPLTIFSPPNTKLRSFFRQFYNTYATNAPCSHLYFWLTEASTAPPHSPSERELWPFGKCTKIRENVASTDIQQCLQVVGAGSVMSLSSFAKRALICLMCWATDIQFLFKSLVQSHQCDQAEGAFVFPRNKMRRTP